jgi:serine O-acetyltransferase
MTLPADKLWQHIRDETMAMVGDEPALASYYYSAILNHHNLADAVSFALAGKLGNKTLPAMLLQELINSIFAQQTCLEDMVARDIQAVYERDPACNQYSLPLLYFKGFHALQGYRISHELWRQERHYLALYLQNKISERFGVDIHPGASLGCGIMIDHATALVIGETSVLGNNISMLHSVTLGGTGCEQGKRHPTIGDGVLISAGAKILGNITVGANAKIAAGSVVLSDVPAYATVAGVPATAVGNGAKEMPAMTMEHVWKKLNCD